MRKHKYNVGDYVLIKSSTLDYDGFRHLIGKPIKIERLLKESSDCAYRTSSCGIREKDIICGGLAVDFPEFFL